MDASTAAYSNVVSTQGVLRALQVSLQLFAFLFQKQAVETENFTYDFIIAGGGSAGSLLASRLSENKDVSVLLIEAGDNPPFEALLPGLGIFNQQSKFDWNYTSVDDNHAYQCYKNKGSPAVRGHGLGGSSSINYFLYVRGAPIIYNQWAEITNDSTWNYENVLPYFKKSERMENSTILNSKYKMYHGTTGEMAINIIADPNTFKYMTALNDVGFKTVLDTNGEDTLGFCYPMYDVANCVRQSSCYCFLSPAKNRTNLHVLRNTRVNKVIFNTKNEAIGVEVANSTDTWIIQANKEVILSAGAFNSPQLLMLSGIGPKEHLKSFNIQVRADLPVGHNLIDHVGVIIAHQTGTYNADDNVFDSCIPSLLSINGFVTMNESQTYPDAQYLLAVSTNPENFVSNFAFSLLMENYIGDIAYKANLEKEVVFTYIVNLRPESRGRVMLNSTDPADKPKVYLDAFANKTDLDTIIKYVKYYLRIENSPYFKNVNATRIDLAGDKCKGFEMNSDEYWQCYALCLMASIYHYSGTCPMGTVVDGQLRVKGVQGLRVVDSSVFPIIPTGNTNAPTLMVAEKAADMIKTQYNI